MQKFGPLSLTGEYWPNEDTKGLRRFRIEYGFECSCPEGLIYLPDDVDPDMVEDWLNSIIKYECHCWDNGDPKP